MDINGILALTGVIAAIIIVVIQQMYPTIPKYIGWPIVVALLIAAVAFASPSHIDLVWEIVIIICLLIIGCMMFVFFWKRRKLGQPKTDVTTPLSVARSHIHKEKAQVIHKIIMKLFILLEKTKEGLSPQENWQQHPKITDIIDKLQIELNNLGYLVHNTEYDRWAEAVMVHQSKMLKFHTIDRDDYSEWGRARINAKLRVFINKIKD
ncbi:MAG: hypothetical protein JXA17_06890 [Dehalococcoidales bacterium]|nr:hypothetical protein [Dehalococcoidales bacterium]